MKLDVQVVQGCYEASVCHNDRHPGPKQVCGVIKYGPEGHRAHNVA